MQHNLSLVTHLLKREKNNGLTDNSHTVLYTIFGVVDLKGVGNNSTIFGGRKTVRRRERREGLRGRTLNVGTDGEN